MAPAFMHATYAMPRDAASWLGLAAAPTFAVMALASGLSEAVARSTACADAAPGSVVHGMAAMYLLMAVFHLAPWLRLASARTRAAHKHR